MSDSRARLDVSEWDVVDYEPVGRDRKVWLQEPGAIGAQRRRWLFKPAVVPSNGRRQDEDRTEAVVADLAALLDIPHAQARLARRAGVEGSLSRDVAPAGWNLVLGSVLLTRVVPGYQEGARNVPGRPGHSVTNIARALADCVPLPGSTHAAFDIFAAYLLLDAWVANQDRHDQNWAVLRSAGTGEMALAPSFDHASSLGFSLGDETRRRLVEERGVQRWARRGRAYRFEHTPGDVPDLVAVARTALRLADPTARSRWLGRLRGLSADQIAATVRQTTELSDPSVTFILQLLDVNRRRILDEC